ncbi:MAG: GTPase HflX [Candidatus Omnitrophica bacterium]|nr:GTPase HflX [Candidatus Omnitrophota bacterium]
MKTTINLKQEKERIFLAVVSFKRERPEWVPKDILEEMESLVVACGGQVVGSMFCVLDKPTASHLIGKGKVEEIASACQLAHADTVIFSEDLKGSQQRNLEDDLKVRTIDRTQLILDIFAHRAKSNEGKMQVELAQLEYLLPRLVGKRTELSRLGGGIGTSGPGETKLEIDRRRIAEKITRLKADLKTLATNQDTKRKKRKEKGLPIISLVGYTNAGKSTLFNTVTQSEQETKDGLFTTLDSLSRQLLLPNRQRVVLSDTVGFMHDLPHHLIEAFKTTLQEVQQADLLLHVIDISHPNFRNMIQAVMTVLDELNVLDKPVIHVFNKIDLLEDKEWVKNLKDNYEHAVYLSAKTGENLPSLLTEISQILSALFVEIDVLVPINRMDLVSLAHQEGEVLSIKYYSDKINIRVAVPTNIAGVFLKAAQPA